VLVLPGVGAFGDCAAQLRARNLWESIAGWLREGRPFLGICLGYQLLFESSEESPEVEGFGHFAGAVRRIGRDAVKVPHIGWNTVKPTQSNSMLWQGLETEPHFYFVHSFVPEPADPATVAAYCDYGGRFAAAVSGPGPLLATQFHPEKSQRAGLTLLRNFIASIGTRALA
jgi:imidazole glycerol-phosphate synthase subunit HisH